MTGSGATPSGQEWPCEHQWSQHAVLGRRRCALCRRWEPEPPAPAQEAGSGRQAAVEADDRCPSCRGDMDTDCGHHSWGGLMALLDEHWPADIFPTVTSHDRVGDAGARIVSLMRWVDQLRAEVAALSQPGEPT